MSADMVRTSVAELIRTDHPQWSSDSYICLDDLNRYRVQYVGRVMEIERGEISALDADVLRSLQEQELISEDTNKEIAEAATFGERIADRLASFGGSWTFLISFGLVLCVWITLNSVALLQKPFDPFPFILLNLVLSCLAAIQAPVIMMSQNRQEARDRLRAEHDYRVNLKAELEIRHLHSKLDMLLSHQWQRLLEIQQIQTELIQQLAKKNS
ncbi:MAG: DUF1003 domain-containing protein [Planctomycetaceae bacterium]